jgi:hypothetical protein
MRALLAAVLLAAATGLAPAHADPMSTFSNPCLLVAVAPADTPGQWTGVVYSKPVKLSHVAGDPLATGSLRCTLQVNSSSHTAPDVASSTSPVTPAVAVVAPFPVSYTAPGAFDHADVCAQVDLVGGATFYWDDWARVWSTSPDVECTDHTFIGHPLPLPWNRINQIVGTVNGILPDVDSTVCPVLAALAPGAGPVVVDPTGDTYVGGTTPDDLFWDCPPYRP